MDIVENITFDGGEEVILFKITREMFSVICRADEGKWEREKKFEKYNEAEEFYDSFADGQQVRDYINIMLKKDYGFSI